MTSEPAGDPTPAPPAAPSASPPSAAPSALAPPEKQQQQQQQSSGPTRLTGLPSDTLAHSFAFLPFSDLRSAVLTGKHTALLDAAKRIDTLNITEVADLNLRAVRVQECRKSVEVVSIGCLFKDREDEDGRLRKEVSEKACWQIVHFLVGFPKLREAIFYGITTYSDGRTCRCHIYLCQDDLDETLPIPEHDANNDTRMKALIKNFCGAFRAGALPSDLIIVGLVDQDSCYFCPKAGFSESGGCKMCREVCESFPFRTLESEYGEVCPRDWNRPLNCIRHEDFLRIVSKRPGWGEYVSQHPTTLLQNALRFGGEEDDSFKCLEEYFNIPRSRKNAIISSIARKYYSSQEEFVKSKDNYDWIFCFHPDTAFQAAVDGLISVGFSPANVSAEFLRECIVGYQSPRGPTLIDDDSCQRLISRGFNLDEEKFIRVRRNEVEKLEAIASEWE